MKVVLTLKNGLFIELPIQYEEDFETVTQSMKDWGPFFKWGQLWIRKKEVASIQLIREPVIGNQTI